MIRRQGEVVYAPCGHCGGDGWAIFQRGCQDLYELGDDWVTTAEMADRLRVSTTNAANILSALLSGDIDALGGDPEPVADARMGGAS